MSFNRINFIHRHAREGGQLCFAFIETGIPAFAGMTNSLGVVKSKRIPR